MVRPMAEKPCAPGFHCVCFDGITKAQCCFCEVSRIEACKGPPCDCVSHPGLGNLFGTEAGVKRDE